ncbi:MAG: hypothetical protein BWZ07_03191 [Alphaproteobacteria bacterium ADurb.BinA280]|nr:MAG: hypothetical protein BWZ07_03191 [Alphaproteobacteria bacterium ADurb.BinA280]
MQFSNVIQSPSTRPSAHSADSHEQQQLERNITKAPSVWPSAHWVLGSNSPCRRLPFAPNWARMRVGLQVEGEPCRSSLPYCANLPRASAALRSRRKSRRNSRRGAPRSSSRNPPRHPPTLRIRRLPMPKWWPTAPLRWPRPMCCCACSRRRWRKSPTSNPAPSSSPTCNHTWARIGSRPCATARSPRLPWSCCHAPRAHRPWMCSPRRPASPATRRC